jgi:CHAD domain-containing protein
MRAESCPPMSLEEKRIKTLSENLSAAVANLAHDVTPKHVHRLRTTIRRIESLAGYARPDLGRKQEKALRGLAALRKRAGKVRDLDVQVKLLDAIANTSTRQDRQALTEVLKRKRNRQAARLGAAIAKARDSKLSAHVDRILERVSEALALATPTAPLIRAWQDLAQVSAGSEFNSSTKAKVLHKIRIKIKKIRYLAELAEKTLEQENFVAEMKAAQDVLGDWHDWEELTFTAEKQFGDRVNCPLVVEVRALFGAKQAAATAAVAHLLSSHDSQPVRKQPRSAEPPRAFAQRA